MGLDVISYGRANQAIKMGTPHGVTVGAIGDSITANGFFTVGYAANSISTNILGDIDCRNWPMCGSILSNGAYVFTGAAATGGYTIAQALATHVPTAVAGNPDYCVVHIGTNDISAGTVLATMKSGY